MKRNNEGKKFEEQIRKALDKPELNISMDRFNDNMGGFSNIASISDFCCYAYPYMFYLECKSTYDNTLNFKSDITENQWQGMLAKSKLRGILAGICVWYMSYDETYFVPIQELERLKQEGKKSLNISYFTENDKNNLYYFQITGKKKVKYTDYNTEIFLDNLKKMTERYMNGSDNNA